MEQPTLAKTMPRKLTSNDGRGIFRRWRGSFGVLLVSGGAVAAACSANSGAPKGNSAGDGSAEAGGAAGSAASGGVGATGGTGGSAGVDASTGGGGTGGAAGSAGGMAGASGADAGYDGDIPDVTFGFDAPEQDGFNPDAACAGNVVQGQLSPLDLYIMLDVSGSMTSQGTRWTDVTNALDGFLNDSASAGINVGIQFFPLLPYAHTLNETLCANDAACVVGGVDYGPCGNPNAGPCHACSTSLYSTPAVGIAPLPGNSGPILNTMGAIIPFGETPTAPALQGAVDHANSWLTTHPGHTFVIVLATDGEPNTCVDSGATSAVAEVASIAQAAFQSTARIPTFVIGVGNVANLDTIASAGGTKQAYSASDTGTTAAFQQALEAIRGSTLGCEYVMPTTNQGIIDPKQVQLEWTKGDGSTEIINRVANASACGTSPGFFYDDPNDPTKLLLCPASCTAVQAETGGSVKVSLGCLGS